MKKAEIINKRIRHYFAKLIYAVSGVSLILAFLPLGLANTSAAPACPVRYVTCEYQWQAVSAVSVGGTSIGNWRDCVGFSSSPDTQEITCQTSNSVSNQVTAQIFGSWPAGVAELSALVGYNVTQTTTVTTGDTVIVPAHQSGFVQWAPTFDNLKDVYQNDEWCGLPPGEYQRWQCTPTSGPDEVAQTEQYDCPNYRVVLN